MANWGPVVRWQPAGNDVSTEVEDIVGIRFQAETGEDRRFSEGCNEKSGAWISESVIILCNNEFYKSNKSNYQSKPRV
jgi:hypothetical protein